MICNGGHELLINARIVNSVVDKEESRRLYGSLRCVVPLITYTPRLHLISDTFNVILDPTIFPR